MKNYQMLQKLELPYYQGKGDSLQQHQTSFPIQLKATLQDGMDIIW
jgi:hypothetical protein